MPLIETQLLERADAAAAGRTDAALAAELREMATAAGVVFDRPATIAHWRAILNSAAVRLENRAASTQPLCERADCPNDAMPGSVCCRDCELDAYLGRLP